MIPACVRGSPVSYWPASHAGLKKKLILSLHKKASCVPREKSLFAGRGICEKSPGHPACRFFVGAAFDLCLEVLQTRPTSLPEEGMLEPQLFIGGRVFFFSPTALTGVKLTQVLECCLSLPCFQVTQLLLSCHSVCTLGFLFYCSVAKNKPLRVFLLGSEEGSRGNWFLSHYTVVTFTIDIWATEIAVEDLNNSSQQGCVSCVSELGRVGWKARSC